MLNPSRSRNYPGDWAAWACAINNTYADHSLWRDNNHRHPAEAKSLEAAQQAEALWPKPIANSASGKAASQLRLAESHQTGCKMSLPPLLPSYIKIFCPRLHFPSSRGTQRPPSLIIFQIFFLVGDDATPWSTVVQGPARIWPSDLVMLYASVSPSIRWAWHTLVSEKRSGLCSTVSVVLYHIG